jgi:xylulose-5-phosphate/fructose-6-phosphate phosphoketolase
LSTWSATNGLQSARIRGQAAPAARSSGSRKWAVEISGEKRGHPEEGPIGILAKYLARVIEQNPNNFRIFSPDELMSNKLGGVFESPTQRNYQWPIDDGHRAEHIGARGGRVLEILSEHTCQAWLQGYLLTGRHGLFPSYESFLPLLLR